MFRPVGPPEISIDSAPEVVLRALCLAVIGDLGKANKAAGALIAKREAGRLRAGEIQTALTNVQIEEPQRREISAMLVATPTLYKCVAETTGGNDQVFDRSEGLYLLDETRNDTFKQGGSFLTWEQVPVDRRNDLHR